MRSRILPFIRLRLMRNDKLTIIAESFNINCCSTVSTIIQRVDLLRKKDKIVRKEIELIVKRLNKSQMEICPPILITIEKEVNKILTE